LDEFIKYQTPVRVNTILNFFPLVINRQEHFPTLYPLSSLPRFTFSLNCLYKKDKRAVPGNVQSNEYNSVQSVASEN
jgi:hypothetical protein